MNNISVYLVNASLILLVIRQIREHPLDARSLATPVLAVGCAAVLFLHSVPAGGSDLLLEAVCVLAGALMGGLGGLATRLRLGADGRRRRPRGPARRPSRQASVADLESRPAAVHTVSVKARLAAAGLDHGAARPGTRPAPEATSARVAQAWSRARERGDRQRQALRPLGVVFIAVVVTASAQAHPRPALHGAGLAVGIVLAVYAAAVATAVSVGWARRGPAAQVAVIAVTGGCAVTLAVLQPHGLAEVAAAMGVWIAAVRLPPVPAVISAGAITAALAIAVGLTEQPAAQSAITAVLLCLLLAVTGQFIRRGRESQDRTEVLLAQLQDAREAEAAAAALAERGRIAGELHDVLAHSLSGLAIQLQGARKLAGREAVSDPLRAAIDRSAELTKAGLADARQAVSALRGEQLPTVDQLSTLVEDFRRDTGTEVTLRIDGTARPLPAEASLALFRGTQEALTNITRYAPGATTAVTVTYQPGRTLVTIEDHICPAGTDPSPAPAAEPGVAPAAEPGAALAAEPGLAPAAEPGLLVGAGGGHGLTAMRERAQRAGGTARAGPTASGWLVELEVPA